MAQSVVCWARCPAWCSVASSNLLWTSGTGCFPLELTWVLTPFPKTLSDESMNRVCVHMNSIARTPKILTFMSQTGERRQQKHTQHAPSTKTECAYLYGWIIKRSHAQNLTQKRMNPRDIVGNAEEEFCDQPTTNSLMSCNTCWACCQWKLDRTSQSIPQ